MGSQTQERRVKEMKRVTKIIALASMFSFIISYSSLIFSLQQRFQHLLSMYSNLVNKKFMFLLCNGIVGFILGSFRGNSETHLHGKAINIVEQTKQVRIIEMRETEVKKAVALLGVKSVSKEQEQEEEQEQEQEQEQELVQEEEEEQEQEEEEEQEQEQVQEQEEERVALVRGRREEVAVVVEDDEANLVQDLAIFRIHDHDDETDDSLLSSEDINKKCEEFIRKMKANIRSESRNMKANIRSESRKMITL